MKKIVWHLPYAIIGGVETLYATILKFMGDRSGLEHYITCHQVIKNWVQNRYRGHAKIFPYSDVQDLANALKTINPSLIMGTHGMTLYQALQVTPSYPVIEIVHGSHTWVEHNAKMPKDWTQHIVCVSKSAERNYLRSSSSVIETSVIINGVDTTLFYPRKHFQVSAKNIGYFGRFLEEDKHLTKMVDAFRSLGNVPAKLYLIGGTPVEILRLKNHIKRRKIQKQVLFFEHAEEPQKYYEELDICTVRSQAEGYCNSAAEALASGTPLVCYSFGGILEHVPPGTIAVGKTQAEYASQLLKVFKDCDLRRSMREKGLQFVKEEGNAKVMANKYYDLINSFVAPMKVTPIKETSTVEIPYVGTCSVSSSSSDPDSFLKTKKIVGVYTPYWHGIATATKMITNAHVQWESDYKEIVKKIIKHSPDAVLFSGLPEGFKEAATLLRNKKPGLPIFGYYHGGVSHFSFSNGIFGPGERNALGQIIDLAKRGVFNRIAVSSPGLAEVGRVNNIPFVFCGNIVGPRPKSNLKQLPGLHIGNWNRHLDHKHTTIGIAASNLLEDSAVHMLECPYRVPGLDYSRVRFYKEMSQPELYKKYRLMTMNLQMSFIETYNISVLEMWACGTPVVLGPGNLVLLESNRRLKELCYVEDHTNPQRVAETIKIVQNERDNVISEINKSLKLLNAETKARWFYFFNSK